jgi:hypothetical protein
LNTYEEDKAGVWLHQHVAFATHTRCECGVGVVFEYVWEAEVPVEAKPYVPLDYPGPPPPKPPREGLSLFRVIHYGPCERQYREMPKAKLPWYRKLLDYSIPDTYTGPRP